MLRKITVALVVMALLGCCPMAFANIVTVHEPNNLALLRFQLIAYHDAGRYDHDISNVINQAMQYLRERVQQNKNSKTKKLAIVFDIDETVLSNYTNLRRLDFCTSCKDTAVAQAAGHDPAIIPTQNLYNFAKKNNISVFFITGRPEILRKSTESNLRNAGYTTWKKLYLYPNMQYKKSIVPYKSAARKEITEQGYDIVLNIGDQISDLEGGYADKSFKLPNPYYYLP